MLPKHMMEIHIMGRGVVRERPIGYAAKECEGLAAAEHKDMPVSENEDSVVLNIVGTMLNC